MPASGDSEFDNMVSDVFRKAGWRVRLTPSAGDTKADLIVQAPGIRYVVEVKSAAEGRGDRFLSGLRDVRAPLVSGRV